MLTDEKKKQTNQTRQSYLVSLFRTSAFSLAIVNELRFLSIAFKTNEINIQKNANKLKIKAYNCGTNTGLLSFAARNERNENWRTFEPFTSVCVARSPHTLFRFPLSCAYSTSTAPSARQCTVQPKRRSSRLFWTTIDPVLFIVAAAEKIPPRISVTSRRVPVDRSSP